MQKQHSRHRLNRSRARAIALGLAIAGCLAVPANAGNVTITDATAHVMEDSVNGRRIEVYMTIENAGAARDRLYAVRSRLGRKTTLAVVDERHHAMGGDGHGATGHAETARHMQTTVLDIPAGGATTLEHGKSHIMLMEPKEAPAVGATFPVTLFFERAGRVAVDVTVVPTDTGH